MPNAPTRRAFMRQTLGGTAALTAAGALPGPVADAFRPAAARAADAPEAPLKGRIKTAVKYHMIKGENLSVTDKFKLLKDTGYDGVEYRRRDGVPTKKLLTASEKTDLPIHGVVNSSNPDIAGAIDLARELGATSVLQIAGRVNADSPYDKNYEQAQQTIREAVPHAEKHETDILVENVWNNFLLSPLEMRRFVDELDSERVGVYFDTGNVVRIGWPEQWIRILGDRVRKLDIKEYSRKKQRNDGLYTGFNVPLGEGSVDWPAVRRALLEIDYRGWATKERGGGGREYLTGLAKRMNHVLALE